MEKVNGRKLSLIFIFILILLVIALLVGKLTFSYLGPTLGEDLSNEGEVTASGDTLIFTKGSNLSLSATTDNFQTGGSNLSSTTNPKVRLIASSKTNSASATYYVGVVINSNSYTYTTSDNTAEVILTIKDENGNNVTSGVDGLTYVTSGGVSGFDVTGKTGLFNIKTNYPISTTSSSAGTTHTWTFTLTFVNLGTDQSDNENSSMDLDIYLQKTKVSTSVAEVCASGDNLADCIVNLSNKSSAGATGIYHHDGTLKNGINDDSYRYAGVDYKLTEKATSDGVRYVFNGSYEEDVLINGDYELQYDTTNTHYRYNKALEKAIADGYLLNDFVKNFVCFGSDASTCPTENLYRIIGVIDGKVKLIKYDYMTAEELGTNGSLSDIIPDAPYINHYNYRGLQEIDEISAFSRNNDCENNAWSESLLNTINLNTNYINNIGSTWAEKIAPTTWKVGEIKLYDIYLLTPSVTYTNEITNPQFGKYSDGETEYSAKIGLMYISDNVFAAVPELWSSTIKHYVTNDININWMNMGIDEWTITRDLNGNSATYAACVDTWGSLPCTSNLACYPKTVRVAFNLESSVSYVSGTGTQSDPVRLS